MQHSLVKLPVLQTLVLHVSSEAIQISAILTIVTSERSLIRLALLHDNLIIVFHSRVTIVTSTFPVGSSLMSTNFATWLCGRDAWTRRGASKQASNKLLRRDNG